MANVPAGMLRMMSLKCLGPVSAAICLLALAGAASAQAPAAPPAATPLSGANTAVPPLPKAEDVARKVEAEKRGIWTFVNENDFYSRGNTDRHYSNGLRLSYMSADGGAPQRFYDISPEVPLFSANAARRLGFSIGHNLYTPEDKTRAIPDPRDRPYAAFLYAGFAMQSELPNRLDTIELDIGVIGPAAMGEGIQNHWHGAIGVNEAEGWDYQLKNEPGIALIYERKWRYEQPIPLWSGLGVDFIPHVTASLGNVFTYAGFGGIVRLGDDLGVDFGPPRIRPALPGSGSFRPGDGFAWYLFAGAEARAVARDITLDGNTFTNSRSVEKNILVGDFQLGLAVVFENLRISYTQVLRTKEFEDQRRPDLFGSLSISARF
jgi:lipid A 3-O-deacylase